MSDPKAPMSTEVHKIVVKFYAEPGTEPPHDQVVPALHSWIQQQKVSDHMLVDVADYAHVHNGPGTVLVAHEANFYVDRFDGTLGLSYSRKQPAGGEFLDRLRQAFTAALEGCARLEDDPRLSIRFRADEVSIKLNDRLLAPNTPATFESVRGDIEAVAKQIFAGADVELEHYQGEKTLFEVRLRITPPPPNIAVLLSRLETTATA